MNRRHALAIAGGIATLLASLPLSTIFANWRWLFDATIAVVLVVGAAMLARRLRAPAWAQVLISVGALALGLTWQFPSGHELIGVIPTPTTLRHFTDLLGQAGQQIRDTAPPVPNLPGLLLLTTLGVGLMALLIDTCVVTLRVPALAGLPMLALYAVPVAVLAHGISLLWFGTSAAGFLWLLAADNIDRVRRFGRRFTGDGRPVEEWQPSPLAATGRRLGIAGIAAALLIPLLVPGLSVSLADRLSPTGTTGHGTGVGGAGDAVDLAAFLRDDLTRDTEFEMAQVTTNDPNPYYLRMATAVVASDAGFVAVVPNGGVPVRTGMPPFTPPVGASTQAYTATVQTNDLEMGYAPLYEQAVDVQGLGGDWTFDADTHQLFSPTQSIRGQTYTFDYVSIDYSPDLLRTAGPVTQTVPDVLVQIPRVDAVTTLVDQLTAGAGTEYDRVLSLFEYLSPANGFTYSLRVPPGNTGSPILDFLQNKQGFCVQYAATLAWLVRVAGYPSRVAFGFTRGTPIGGAYRLTNFNLHAWTEVLFPGIGWVPFDATPAAAIVGAVRPAWAPDTAQTAQGDTPSDAPTGDEPQDRPTLGPVSNVGDGGTSSTATGPTAFRWTTLIAPALGLLVLLVLLIPGLRRRQVRRRRRALTPQAPPRAMGSLTPALATDDDAIARRDAHRAWDEALDTMLDLGVPLSPALTPPATAQFLRTFDLAADAIWAADLLALAEDRARYAGTPLRADHLDRAVAVLRDGLAADATRWQRVRAVAAPPSVILDAQLRWSGLLGRALDVRTRARAALSTPWRRLRRS